MQPTRARPTTVSRFKTTLFERSPRGVELTPAGDSLLPDAKALLVEINQMQADMRDHAKGSKRVLRILAYTSVITEALPDDLASFAQANPDVRLIAEERWSDEIVRSLLAAEGDVGIVVEGVATEGLDTFPYRIDRLAVVLRADHALASVKAREAAPRVAFEDVLDDDLIALESGSSMLRLLAQQAVIAERTLLLRCRCAASKPSVGQRHPRLVTCDISGYGESGPLQNLKAYDLLVQAESGLVATSGAPGPWGRIGESICDISAGMNALIGVQQALMQRALTGQGSGVRVSLFDSAAELMAVPYLQTRYRGKAPERVGLKHPSIAPYGAFTCSDGREIVLSIQNEREWASFCAEVLGDAAMASDTRFDSNAARVRHRPELEALIQAVFGHLTHGQATDRLTEAKTAFGAINSVHDLIHHPQLRTRPMDVNGRCAEIPALPYRTEWDDEVFASAPKVGQHC